MNISDRIIGLRGYIVNFRIGSKGRNPRWRQLIVRFDLPEGLKPDNLIGRTVELRWKNKVFRGKIYRKHGKNCVRVFFETPPPGQVLLGNYDLKIVK